jgi:pantoate--beta-alanine ligase
LAMSSRNAYLNQSERASALCLSRALREARNLYCQGVTDIGILKNRVHEILGTELSVVVDYVEFRSGETLEEAASADERTLLALAVKIGKTRLIDNCILGGEF